MSARPRSTTCLNLDGRKMCGQPIQTVNGVRYCPQCDGRTCAHCGRLSNPGSPCNHTPECNDTPKPYDTTGVEQ